MAFQISDEEFHLLVGRDIPNAWLKVYSILKRDGFTSFHRLQLAIVFDHVNRHHQSKRNPDKQGVRSILHAMWRAGIIEIHPDGSRVLVDLIHADPAQRTAVHGIGSDWAARGLEVKPRRDPVPRKLREMIFVRDGAACVHCGADEDLTIDHIIPVAAGGTDDPANLQVLCRRCNSAKGASL